MAHALSKEHLLSIAARSHSSQLRHRQHKRMIESTLIRKATVTIAAATMGAMKKAGWTDEIPGIKFPWKLLGWTIATTAEVLAKPGPLQAVAAGASDSFMAVYVHDAVATGSLIAGNGGELAA
jgi:hypothetical protein